MRIYRRDPASTTAEASLVGIVEEASSGVSCCFHDMDELWAILCGTKSSTQDKSKAEGR